MRSTKDVKGQPRFDMQIGGGEDLSAVPQRCYLYIFDMQNQIQEVEFPPIHKKIAVTTPATAESFLASYSPRDLFQLGSVRFSQDEPLFNVAEEEFQHKFLLPEGPKNMNEVWENEGTEEVENSCLRVGIRVFSENNQLQKYFEKLIKQITEIDGNASLVFDNQHEKVSLEPGAKKILKVSLLTNEGFERNIWSQPIQTTSKPKRWETVRYGDEKEGFQIFFDSECFKQINMKPLGLKIQMKTIEDFLDQKLRLLNKSEELNSLESITDLKGILYPLTQQNMGSRIIQKLLNRATHQQIDAVIKELEPEICNMVPDRYGNYVVQKMFKIATQQQKQSMLSHLFPHLCGLLKTKAGTHSLQALLDFLTIESLLNISQIAADRLQELCMDEFAHHFIQKLMKLTNVGNLFYPLLNSFSQLAADRYGVVVLKCLMGLCAKRQDLSYYILGACQEKFSQIAYTQYGHYIIEQLFLYYNIYELEQLLSYLTSYITYIAQNQYSSSIVRKSIETFGDCISIPYIQVLLEGGIDQLMESCTGSFILHRLMELTQDVRVRQCLINKMYVVAPQVRCYEKKQKWMKFFNIPHKSS